MTKINKVAILQSNYIPWKGYFDIIHDVDIFIFYDDVQFTKNDWRNRNKIKTQNGTSWLSIPVGSNLKRLICEVQITNTLWAKKHWQSIKQYYSRAPYFAKYRNLFEYIYLGAKWESLSELNQFIIKSISSDLLGIKTIFKDSREYSCLGSKFDRLLDLIKKTGAYSYVSGPAAKGYINDEILRGAQIELCYKDYSGYPEYPQFYPPFDHNVTILDLLFHVGQDAPYYIWGWRNI